MMFKAKIKHPDLNNALLDVTTAVEGMAVHHGDVRDRPCWAYQEARLSVIGMYKLPPELKAQWQKWRNYLKPQRLFDSDGGSVPAALAQMKEADAYVIAGELVAFARALDAEEAEAYEAEHAPKKGGRR